MGLARLRRRRGWSAERLAREADVSVGTVFRMEHLGVRSARLETAELVCKALGITVDELLREEDGDAVDGKA